MNRISSAQNRRKQIARHLMSFAFIGSFTFASQIAAACDCCSTPTCSQGCDEPACGVAEPTCGCGSSGCGGCRTSTNPIMKTLDAVAGGIEKVLGLDRCHQNGCSSGCDVSCEAGCDDACDSAFAQELMVPIQSPPTISTPPSHSVAPVPSLPTVPPIDPSPAPMSQPRMIQPRTVMPMAPTPAPAMTPNPEPAPADSRGVGEPQMDEPADDKNIFDSLDDPFGDDEVRLRRPYRQVQPTSHDSASRLRQLKTGHAPVFSSLRQAATRQNHGRNSFQDSRRPVSSNAVQPASHTDGLRPLNDSVPELRPIQHSNIRQAPAAQRNRSAGPPKMATGRVLAPYRQSNF